MREYRTWEEILMERFTSDWEEAIGYLDVALEEYQEDGDTPFFLLGLENVIEAQGGITELAKQTGIEPQLLSEMLSSNKAPRLDIFSKVLRGLGCRLSIQLLENVDPNGEMATDEGVVPLPEGEKPKLELANESSELR